MRKLARLLSVLLLCAGCASGPEVVSGETTPPGEPDVTRDELLAAGVKCVQNGITANDKGKEEEAQASFELALRHLYDMDAPQRERMDEAGDELRKIVKLSGFEYAPNESQLLMVAYLELQRAYLDRDLETFNRRSADFDEAVLLAREMTVQGKQERLEKLGREVDERRADLKKQGDEKVFSVWPTIYVVKKGDTLPSIAARHEIYNDSFMWPLIYKANRDQIKDPKSIYAGQDFKIPRDITMEEIIQARREAGAPDPEKLPKGAFVPRHKK